MIVLSYKVKSLLMALKNRPIAPPELYPPFDSSPESFSHTVRIIRWRVENIGTLTTVFEPNAFNGVPLTVRSNTAILIGV